MQAVTVEALGAVEQLQAEELAALELLTRTMAEEVELGLPPGLVLVDVWIGVSRASGRCRQGGH